MSQVTNTTTRPVKVVCAGTLTYDYSCLSGVNCVKVMVNLCCYH